MRNPPDSPIIAHAHSFVGWLSRSPSQLAKRLTTKPKLTANLIVLLFGMAFFTSARWNTFRICDQEAWRWFQADSQSLVEVKLLEIEKGSGVLQGGNLRQNIPFFEHRPVSDLYAVETSITKSYTSQFGLQAMTMAFFSRLRGMTVGQAVSCFETIIAAVTTLTLMFMIRWIAVEFSLWAAGMTAAGIFFGPFPTSMARNLYWVEFTFFLPFIPAAIAASRKAMVSANPPLQTSPAVWKSPWVFLGIPLMVMVKCLCGYEYLTNLILGCALPFLYVGLREGHPFWRCVIPRCATVCAIACLGFFTAFALHVLFVTQIVLPDGGGVSAIMSRVTSNTVLPRHALFLEHHGLSLYVMLVTKYIIADAMNIGSKISFGRGDFYIFKATYLGLVALGGLGILTWLASGKKATARLRAATLTAIIAWGASFSWLFLAKGHQHHFHLNNWMFWLYAMPLMYAFFGSALSCLFDQKVAAQSPPRNS